MFGNDAYNFWNYTILGYRNDELLSVIILQGFLYWHGLYHYFLCMKFRYCCIV
jgi:hypothetical protein